jgi:guanylate kinase
MENTPPVLITLTAPTAAGKSYLFNYIRDVAKLPCLISTTTRLPRDGEVEGVDYYFIDLQESKKLEEADQFAELAIYRGVRYGVTKKEWNSKLQPGKIAFLIVEPSGIDHYVKPAVEAGALWLKYFIHTPPEVRMNRFIDRMLKDVIIEVKADIFRGKIDSMFTTPSADTLKTVVSYFDRQKAMLTDEMKWFQKSSWERTLMGTDEPSYNLSIIQNDIRRAVERHMNDT